jgi:outer membrane protein
MRAAAFILAFLATGSAKLEAQTPPPAPAWNVSIGGGMIVTPTHAGSDEYRLLPFPLVQVTFRDRVYAGPSNTGVGGGVGAHIVRTQRIGLAVELGVMENRPADRSDVLVGTTNRDLLGTAGANLSYRAGAIEGALGVIQGLNDDGGLLGTARLAFTRIFRQRVIATMDASAALADARHMRREFGVTEVESARRTALIIAGDSRLRPGEGEVYRPDAGLSHLRTSISLTYLLSQQWAITGFGGASRLGDEAAGSPLVRQREQFSGGIGVVWRPEF